MCTTRFFAILLALVVTFTAGSFSNAEAARRDVCTCIQPNGTMNQRCPAHRDCRVFQRHQHDDSFSRSMPMSNAPILCEVERDVLVLLSVNGPTCRQVRDRYREQQRAQREQERAARRAQQRAEREYNRYGAGYVTGLINKRIDQNNRRVEREIRNNIRRRINDRIDDWYGF